jgi:hypothetical protein
MLKIRSVCFTTNCCLAYIVVIAVQDDGADVSGGDGSLGQCSIIAKL